MENMERNEILAKLQTVFQEELDNNRLVITEESSANNVDGWDSLSHVQLISAVEDEFDISFTSKEIMNWKNIGEMITSIQNYL